MVRSTIWYVGQDFSRYVEQG